MQIPVEVGLKNDVLKAIGLMFRNKFVEAENMIDNSIENRPCIVRPIDVTSFGDWIDMTYGLRDVEASSSGNNPCYVSGYTPDQ
jgi:hypothetical protein